MKTGTVWQKAVCWLAISMLFACTGFVFSAAAQEKCDLVKVAEGIYAVIQKNTLQQPLEGNSIIIINDADVVVVDSQQTPAAARSTIAEIKKLTGKPVRYLINTHWHNDHNQGNFVYQQAFPNLEIIAHRDTREDIAKLAAQTLAGRIGGFQQRAQFGQMLDAGVDGQGKQLSEAVKHRLRQRLSIPESHLRELQEVKITLPTLTYERTLTFERGSRTITLFCNGPGNTRSDTIVWLPQERIVITGDLLVSTVPFMSESRPRQWLARLKEIAALNPTLIIPGHGQIQPDRQHLDRHIAMLESLIEQVDAAVRLGLSLEETRKRVKLDAFRRQYSQGDEFLMNEFDFRVTEPAVVDAYDEALAALKKRN